MKNKRGQLVALLMIVGFLALILIGALVISLGTGIITFTSSTINDITSDLGVVGDTNLSAASDMSIGKANEVVQMAKWGSGVALVFSLIGILILASVIRMKRNGFLIGFYIMLIIVLVLIAIFVSNIYESFLEGGDEIAMELKTMPLTSFIIIYFPAIVTVIGFVGGIVIFSGISEEFG